MGELAVFEGPSGENIHPDVGTARPREVSEPEGGAVVLPVDSPLLELRLHVRLVAETLLGILGPLPVLRPVLHGVGPRRIECPGALALTLGAF